MKTAQMMAYTPLSQMRRIADHGIPGGPLSALRAGINELEKSLGPTDPGLAVLYKMTAECCVKACHFSDAENACIELLAIYQGSHGERSAAVADAHCGLSDCYLAWGRSLCLKSNFNDARSTFEKAEKSCVAATNIYNEVFGANNAMARPLKSKMEECVREKLKAASSTKNGLQHK